MSETVAVVQSMNEEQVRSVVYSVLKENKTSRYEWPSSADLLERITKVDERVASLSERTVRVEQELKDLKEAMDKRFALMQWTVLFGFTLLGVMISVYKFIP